jgi:diguanylate cyclase (GGDEF)-like protein/PAS domain S-box-containing protein
MTPLQELLRALERYPSLFALSDDAVGLYGPDGAVVVSNAASRALIHEDFAPFHSGRHIEPGERKLADARFATALSGEPAEFDAVLNGRDGEAIDVVVRLVPALADGSIVGVFGSARDVTERRRAEAGRDEIRQQFRSLFEQHPDSISMVDAAGRYVRLNVAAERILGYTSAEVAGRMVGEVFPPGTKRNELDGYIRRTLLTGKPSRFERTLASKDGTKVTLEGTAVPIVVNEKVIGLFLISHDVTERMRVHDALALAARRTGSLYRLASEIGADPLEQASDAFAFGLGELGFETGFVATVAGNALTIRKVVGTKLPVDANDPLLAQLFRETLANEGVFEAGDAALQLRAKTEGGKPAFCRAFLGIALEGGRGDALGFASSSVRPPLTEFDREFVRAIAELAAVSIERMLEDEHLQGLANFDALTGLPNRLLLNDRFKHAIRTAGRRLEQLAVYFIDVDKFKIINDTHGHHVGDEVLRTVARRLVGACRSSDTVARLGGDEFIVLRTGPSSAGEPEALAARLRAALEAPCEIEGVPLRISVGIGVSVFPEDGRDQTTLLERADTALYAAKACGAGSIRRYGAATPLSAAALLAAGIERRARHLAGARLNPEQPG